MRPISDRDRQVADAFDRRRHSSATPADADRQLRADMRRVGGPVHKPKGK